MKDKVLKIRAIDVEIERLKAQRETLINELMEQHPLKPGDTVTATEQGEEGNDMEVVTTSVTITPEKALFGAIGNTAPTLKYDGVMMGYYKQKINEED